MTARESYMGNCHSSKINVDRGETAVDIGFLGLTISHVNLSCSQYFHIIIDNNLFLKWLAEYNQRLNCRMMRCSRAVSCTWCQFERKSRISECYSDNRIECQSVIFDLCIVNLWVSRSIVDIRFRFSVW